MMFCGICTSTLFCITRNLKLTADEWVYKERLNDLEVKKRVKNGLTAKKQKIIKINPHGDDLSPLKDYYGRRYTESEIR